MTVIAKIISLFFLTELLARFIFFLFLSSVERKGRKINRARNLSKKTDLMSYLLEYTQYFKKLFN